MNTTTNTAFVETCRKFAEADLDAWYRYVLTESDDGRQPDWETYSAILETQAVTTEEIRAKALAYVAFEADILSDAEPDKDPCARFLSSLLRDLVMDDYAEIIGRLAEKYGPLPPNYTADGLWLGHKGEAE